MLNDKSEEQERLKAGEETRIAEDLRMNSEEEE